MSDAESCDRSSSTDSTLTAERLPATNNVIRGQKGSYAVGHKLSHGRFGAVYEVLRRGDGKHLAAKLEVCDSHFHGLNMDFSVLRAANKSSLRHFAQLVDHGNIEGHFKFVVMQLLGRNLESIRHDFQQNRFSAPTAIRLGLEMLSALEELHSLGFVHRDVKPGNFVVCREEGKSQLFLIDFGVCRQYRASGGETKPPREKAPFRGTARYAPLAAHLEREQSPKDDLESWLYVLVEMFSGELPWTKCHRNDRVGIRKLKEAARTADGLRELFKYSPRNEFRRIMKYLDGMDYFGHPDYTFLRNLLILAAKNYEIRLDKPMDWEIESEGSDSEPQPSSSTNHQNPKQPNGPKSNGVSNRVPVSEKLEQMVKRISIQNDQKPK